MKSLEYEMTVLGILYDMMMYDIWRYMYAGRMVILDLPKMILHFFPMGNLLFGESIGKIFLGGSLSKFKICNMYNYV